MKKGCIIAGISLAVLAIIFIIACISTYNGLIGHEEQVEKGWSEIDNMLQRRADLIPNLVETVKGYAAHEEQIFSDVAEARSRLLGAQGVESKAQAAGALNGALGRLLAIAENYPNLKADQSFLRLQDELAGTENRIAVARSRYNDAVRAYNQAIRSIPGVFFAPMLGMDKRPYFEIQDEADREVPSVDFGGE